MIKEKMICKKCNKKLNIINHQIKAQNGSFKKTLNGVWFVGNVCPLCRNKARMKKHIADNYCIYKRYEKTENGFLMRIYRNMKSRITGIQKQKAHLYVGKYLLPKEDFYAWAKNSSEFKSLFKKYEESKYDRKLAPSVDRIDSSKGYEISNMEWVTHSENSRRGNFNRFNHTDAKQEGYPYQK